jgi:hypothetical protein
LLISSQFDPLADSGTSRLSNVKLPANDSDSYQ